MQRNKERDDAERPTTADTEGNSTGGTTATAVEFVRFEVLRNAFYHDRRETFFRRTNKAFSFANIILGSAAVGAFATTYPAIGQMIGFIVAATSAAQLVYDPSGQARDHRDLRRRFYATLALIEGGEDPIKVQSKLPEIYADEPPINMRTSKAADAQARRLVWGDDFSKP